MDRFLTLIFTKSSRLWIKWEQLMSKHAAVQLSWGSHLRWLTLIGMSIRAYMEHFTDILELFHLIRDRKFCWNMWATNNSSNLFASIIWTDQLQYPRINLWCDSGTPCATSTQQTTSVTYWIITVVFWHSAAYLTASWRSSIYMF